MKDIPQRARAARRTSCSIILDHGSSSAVVGAAPTAALKRTEEEGREENQVTWAYQAALVPLPKHTRPRRPGPKTPGCTPSLPRLCTGSPTPRGDDDPLLHLPLLHISGNVARSQSLRMPQLWSSYHIYSRDASKSFIQHMNGTRIAAGMGKLRQMQVKTFTHSKKTPPHPGQPAPEPGPAMTSMGHYGEVK